MRKPRERLNRITPRWLEVCQALAECDMNVAQAARELSIRRSTLQGYMERIAIHTGLSPANFYDLHELLYMEVEKND